MENAVMLKSYKSEIIIKEEIYSDYENEHPKVYLIEKQISYGEKALSGTFTKPYSCDHATNAISHSHMNLT